MTIIHLGDHDPSGVDMSRDIENRIRMFIGYHLVRDFVKDYPVKAPTEGYVDDAKWSKWHKNAMDAYECQSKTGSAFTLNRIALTMDQIREYDPPPNPAKLTDSRSNKYVNEYGDESWELDALEPTVLTRLIRDAVFELRNDNIWDSSVRVEDNAKKQLKGVAEKWEKVVKAIK